MGLCYNIGLNKNKIWKTEYDSELRDIQVGLFQNKSTEMTTLNKHIHLFH